MSKCVHQAWAAGGVFCALRVGKFSLIWGGLQEPKKRCVGGMDPSRKQQQPSTAHQHWTMTIQHAPGNDDNRPLGCNNKGPYTKIFLHF